MNMYEVYRNFDFRDKVILSDTVLICRHRELSISVLAAMQASVPHLQQISLREKSNAASSARVGMTTGPKSVKRIASLMSMTLEM